MCIAKYEHNSFAKSSSRQPFTETIYDNDRTMLRVLTSITEITGIIEKKSSIGKGRNQNAGGLSVEHKNDTSSPRIGQAETRPCHGLSIQADTTSMILNLDG